MKEPLENPFFISGRTRKKNKYSPKNSEKEFADFVGGVRHPMSGARSDCKGDVSANSITVTIDNRFVFDLKDTEKNGFYLNQDILIKLEDDARRSNGTPCLVVNYICPKKKLVNDSWVIMPRSVLRRIERENAE